MIAAGFDDYTVMEISGHSTTRMLARYTHPTERRKVAAPDSDIAELLRKVGGRQGDRTPDLCIANARGKRRKPQQS